MSSSVVGKNSQDYEARLVSASNGEVRVFTRQRVAEAINSEACIVYEIGPLALASSRASFSEFERLAAEVAADLPEGGGTARLVEEGRQWVAKSFYDEEPTLASLRLAAGLSQRQLADAIGVKQPHISRYESGLHEPGVSTAEAMARAMGVPLDLFVRAWKASRLQSESESTT